MGVTQHHQYQFQTPTSIDIHEMFLIEISSSEEWSEKAHDQHFRIQCPTRFEISNIF